MTTFQNEVLFLERDEKISPELLREIGVRFAGITQESERETRQFIKFLRTGYRKTSESDVVGKRILICTRMVFSNFYLDFVPWFKAFQYMVKKFYDKYHQRDDEPWYYLSGCYEELCDTLLMMANFIDCNLLRDEADEKYGYLGYLGDIDCVSLEKHVNFVLRFADGEYISRMYAKRKLFCRDSI